MHMHFHCKNTGVLTDFVVLISYLFTCLLPKFEQTNPTKNDCQTHAIWRSILNGFWDHFGIKHRSKIDLKTNIDFRQLVKDQTELKIWSAIIEPGAWGPLIDLISDPEPSAGGRGEQPNTNTKTEDLTRPGQGPANFRLLVHRTSSASWHKLFLNECLRVR